MTRGLELLCYEIVGAVQPGEEKAAGRPYSSLPVPEGACKKTVEGLFTRTCSDRTRGNGFKLKEGRFRLVIRKKFFTLNMVRNWNRCPEKLWMPPPWKCSSPGWMGL